MESVVGDFARRLRSLRKASGMTQREVSERLQLERSTYAYYEIGKTTPGYDVLRRIAALYQVSVDYLLGNDTPEPERMHQHSDPFSPYDGAARLNDYNEEERSFLTLFRMLDLDAKQKLLLYCMELNKKSGSGKE